MRRRGGWLLPTLLVLLIAVPIFEVWLLIQVGHQIGVVPTIAILVGEAILGAWLMRREGSRAWKALNVAFGTGRMPTGELADGALILVGGVLLMLPGFATDIVGFFCLAPLTRPLARRSLAFFVARRIQRLGLPLLTTDGRRGGLHPSTDIIEGETVDAPAGARPEPPASRQIISGDVPHDR